jgi:hypothetical protein
MIRALSALAGLSLTVSNPAWATESGLPSVPSRPAAVGAQDAGVDSQSEGESRVANWVAAAKDNGSLPYIIIDKGRASLSLFDASGKLRGEAPVLVGVAIGDEATPGVGNKSLAEIGPAERTTPAGRFVARYGMAFGRQRVLWVDYGTSVALHPVPKGTRKERRRERLLSPTPDDNRITFGCINVPLTFYNRKVRPLLGRKGGVVYILPDTKPLEVVFPRLRVQPFLNGEASDVPQ